MFSKIQEWIIPSFSAILVLAVCVGYNPWPSAFALLVISIKSIADKYFHDSFHDENKLAIVHLKDLTSKLKSKQDALDLRAAFGGNKT